MLPHGLKVAYCMGLFSFRCQDVYDCESVMLLEMLKAFMLVFLCFTPLRLHVYSASTKSL